MKARRLLVFLGLVALFGGALLGQELVGPALASLPLAQRPVIRPIDHVERLAFGSGEKLVFQFGWNNIPAAQMSMQVKRMKQNGRWFYVYAGQAQTLPHVEWLYPLSDRVEAVLDEASLQPVHYALYQVERGRKTSTVIEGTGSQFTGRRRDHKNKEHVHKLVRDGHYDPVTVAYLARSIQPVVGEHYTYRVFDGKYEYLFSLLVEAREKVTVKAGTFKALRLKPTVLNITDPAKAKKIRETTIWVSDDGARVPLRVESDVFFGKVYGELIAYSRGDDAMIR